MTWLVAQAVRTDLAAVRDGEPALWRDVRRFNAPVQLAIAAATKVAGRAERPAEAALVSLAPCQSGSPELHGWVRDIEAGTPGVRMNPTHTLHAVDNLALSVLSIRLGCRGWALGLGGAPGQLWTALELAIERPEPEVIVVAGDQRGAAAEGVALLFAREPGPGRPARLVAIERSPGAAPAEPHAAEGARAMIDALRAAPAGRFAYRVPAAHGDGCDDITAIWELGVTRVVVTGMGALSPLGATVDALWRGLIDGRSGIRTLPRLAGRKLEVTTGGEVDDVAVDRIDRDQVIATRAIDDALAEAGRDATGAGFIWSNALDTYQKVGEGLVHRSAGSCFAALAARFAPPRRMIAVACASGTAAIGEAFHLVRGGRVEACVAGGSSVMLGPFYLIGFHALRAVAVDLAGDPPDAACKPFDRSRRGFALADGAGALVLESLDAARRRGAVPLAELVGYGASQDAHDLNRPPADGAGALLAMQRALADAGLPPSAIDAINAHGTATLVGDLAEAAAVRALFGDARVPVSSCKGALGHTMAAAGALETIASIATCRTGVVPPTRNLVEPDETCALDHVIGGPRETGATRVLKASFGMGGQNAALVVSRFTP